MAYRAFIVIALLSIIHAEILRLPKCSKFDANFSIMYNNKRLVGATLARLYELTWMECTRKCIQHQMCKSINYWENGTDELKSECELNSKEVGDKGVNLVNSSCEVGRSVFAQTPKQQKKVGSILQL